MPPFPHRKASRARAAEERSASETGEDPQQRQGLQWLVEELDTLKDRLRAASRLLSLRVASWLQKGLKSAIDASIGSGRRLYSDACNEI
eukprot:107607-Pleurochrysis_carterae.AAC.1